ncbi:hypothetical protein ABPG72_013392 [Tetrahymena utriculariae]
MINQKKVSNTKLDQQITQEKSKVQEIRDQLEDHYLFNSLYSQGLEYLNKITDPEKDNLDEDDAYFVVLKFLLLDLSNQKQKELSKHLISQALAKQYSKARKYLFKALSIQPQNNQVYLDLSAINLKENNLWESKYYIDKILLDEPFSQPGLDTLSYIYEQQNDIEKAELAFITMFQNNLNIFLQYHANYAQLLYKYRFNDPNKRLQVLENLINGFIQNSIESNPNIYVFNQILKDIENLAKAMYQYKFIIYLMEFLDTIRSMNPQLLQKLGIQILKIFQELQYLEIDEEFEDVSDDGFADNDNGEDEKQNVSDQYIYKNIEMFKNSKVSSSSIQSNDMQNLKIFEDNKIYQDPNLVKPISIHQKLFGWAVSNLENKQYEENSEKIDIKFIILQ